MEENFQLITVVGGSGFIGTRLCRMLTENSLDFKVVDKSPSSEFGDKAELADVRSFVEMSRAVDLSSVIVNLAAEHRDDVRPLSLYDDVNVGGARHVCDVAREKDIKKIVFTSSVAVYGFAPIGTNESGKINPFNDYGRTKAEAEEVYREWQSEDAENRTLVIIRPTVVFGEQNRGNVYNLLKLISSGWFVMLGNGANRKSIAYVENVAAFILHTLSFSSGVHIYNYIDKPDFSMNNLVLKVKSILGGKSKIGVRIPYSLGYYLAKMIDGIGAITGRKFPISAIRVKKFCADSVFGTSIDRTEYVAPVTLDDALNRTVSHEFLENHSQEKVYISE